MTSTNEVTVYPICKMKLYCFVYGTYLRIKIKETVVFKSQQQHLILLYILLHQRPG